MRAMACMFCWCRKLNELRHVVDVDLVLAEQRVLEGNVDAAVGVLDIEDDGIAANFAPMLDDAKSVIAGRHDSGEVNGADFEVLGNGNRFFGDWGGRMPGMMMFSLAFRMFEASDLWFAARMASASSEDVRYEVLPR